jgi:pyruvate kinase
MGLDFQNYGFDIVNEPINTRYRRTKIVCTIGPASWSEEGLLTLLNAGMNVARFNFSHGDHEGHKKVLDRLRKVAKENSRTCAGELV